MGYTGDACMNILSAGKLPSLDNLYRHYRSSI
jgi:hypothetical protein